MVIDLHSHFVPLDAANGADVGITLERLDGGEVRFSTAHSGMSLEGHLFDLDRQIGDMQRQRLDRRMLVIPPFCFQYELPSDGGVRWARTLNDGTIRAAATNPEAFVAFGTLPMQDISAALEEMERIATDLQMPGIEIGSNINGIELDDDSLEPFWERANALRLIVLIHPHYIIGPDRLDGYYLRNLLGNPFDTAIAATRLILGGVLDRHPNLRIILSHGGGAFPGILGRVLHGHGVRPEARLHVDDPMAVARRLFYDTIVFEPQMLRYLVDAFGASQIILGTDYPFDMGEEDPVAFVEESELSQEDIQTILTNGDRLIESDLAE
ncbi:MAG: amidohydrolase family protein [Thermomicrobiales bacterium]